ncbi:MAG: prolyl oligopeptidase family serine peptidase [Akkermansiaceae bacterium]|nr:prolyl oligopeptidase family serine peptidase [Akkermansiaceae bacterium]
MVLPKEVQQKTKWLNDKFLLFTPEGNSKENKSPLIIFLHGMGERGENIKAVMKHGPPKIAEQQKDFPFIVVSPQCLKDKNGKGWWHSADLNELLEYVKKTYHVDESRIYLTGLSMGGFGTWKWAAENPDEFAAIVPICGGGNPKDAAKYGSLPIWAFHGDADKTVKIDFSQRMVDAIKSAKGNVKFTIYPGVGHNSWKRTYANPELYQWLLSHVKK